MLKKLNLKTTSKDSHEIRNAVQTYREAFMANGIRKIGCGRGWPIGAACSAVAIASALGAPAALAQTGVGADARDTIVVTATRRDETVLEVPQSIQVLGGENLERLDVTGIEGITGLAPNLNLEGGTKLGGGFNIRGISALSNESTQFATVGLYYGETAISDGFFNFDLATFDVNRVEILKGPQGTLYGEGSLGGTIRLIPNAPNVTEFEARALGRVSATESGGTNYQGAGVVNIPLIEDRLALRVTASYLDQSGFIDSAVEEDFNSRETTYIRAALGWEVTDALTVTPSFLYQQLDANGFNLDGISSPDLTNTSANDDNLDETLKIYALDIEYDFGWANLVSASSYFTREQDGVDDDLFTNAIINSIGVPSPSSPQVFDRERSAFSQEVRLVSQNDAPFDWLIGGYYRNRDVLDDVLIEDEAFSALLPVPIFDRDLDIEYEQFAVFGELSYEILPQLTLTGGIRWFDETIEGVSSLGSVQPIPVAPGLGFVTDFDRPVSINESDVLFKGAVDYQVTDNALVYFLFSQGVRPGGVNEGILDFLDVLTPDEEAALSTYNQDSLNNYEIGLKSSFLDGAVTATLSGFLIGWSGVQLDQEISPGLAVVINAGSAQTTGLEFELAASPHERFDFGIAFGLNDAEISEEFTIRAGEVIADGAPLPFAPEFSGNLFGEYRHPLSDDNYAFARFDARHIGERFNEVPTSANPGTTLADYQILDAQIGVEFGRLRGTVFATNLTDERAELRAVGIGLPPAGIVRNRPRTIGFSLEARY